jgi:hypothetical protein
VRPTGPAPRIAIRGYSDIFECISLCSVCLTERSVGCRIRCESVDPACEVVEVKKQ